MADTNTIDKVCIVTGASSGIGEAAAELLVARGAKVMAAARRTDRLKELQQRTHDHPGSLQIISCDVSKRDQIKQMVDATMEAFGRVDVLVNNAGIMPLAPIVKTRIDDWDDCIDVNVKGLLYGIAYVLPIMLEQKAGHIINVSSIAGRRLFSGAAVYCGTKHAVHAISEGLRGELSEQAKEDGNQIRVTVISPGVVATELPDSIRDDQTREVSTKYYQSLPGPLTSEDAAESILFAIDMPPHVDINEICLRPTSQVT